MSAICSVNRRQVQAPADALTARAGWRATDRFGLVVRRSDLADRAAGPFRGSVGVEVAEVNERGGAGGRARGRPARVYRRDMGQGEAIDITFDFRSDTPPGGDPDSLSPTLGGTTSSCGASRCRVARYSSSTSPLRACTCTTAPSSASSSCRAMRWFRRSPGRCGWSTSSIRSRARSSTSSIASATRSAG